MDTVNTHEETVEDGQHTLDMLEKAEGRLTKKKWKVKKFFENFQIASRWGYSIVSKVFPVFYSILYLSLNVIETNLDNFSSYSFWLVG